jgi:hypothetical protein
MRYSLIFLGQLPAMLLFCCVRAELAGSGRGASDHGLAMIVRKEAPRLDGHLEPDTETTKSFRISTWCAAFEVKAILFHRPHTLPSQLSHVKGSQSGLFYTRHLI